jgi:LysR family carnitine catabolism transcriptional activator
MQMNVSTRQLRAFLALAAHRNFTHAAGLCALSQPAFSALIATLEQAVGTRLFERTTRRVDLTPQGALFEQVAQRALTDFDDAMLGVRDMVERRKGRVSIALLPSLAAGWLPAVFAEFHQAYPGIELEVADVLSDRCLERVRSGSADFALAAVRSDTPELRTEVFCSDRFHLVCRRDHPLATVNPLRLKDLASHPFVQLARITSVRQQLEAAAHPLQMNSVLEVEQLATVMGMVRSGIGISVVPALTLFHFQHADIVIRRLPAAGLTRQIFLIRRRDRPLSPAATALHQLVMARRPR